MYEFRLRGVEILPATIGRIRENICMILANLDPRLNNVNTSELSAHSSLLHAMGLLTKGTGFLISSGYVVTAYHVVKNACRIVCLTPFNNFINLKLVKYDESRDIALLEPETRWSGGISIDDVKSSLHLRRGS